MTKKDELTEKIIKAAILEFTSKGFNSGSMENISNLAEVSKRTLYKYFPNKEAVFDALINKLLDFLLNNYSLTYSKSESIEVQIEKIIDSKMKLMLSPGYMDLSKLILSEVIKGKKLSKDHMRKFYDSELKFLKWIEVAKKDGKIISKQPGELISNQVHSIIKGQIFYPVLFGVKDKLSKGDLRIAKSITIDFFLNSFCKK